MLAPWSPVKRRLWQCYRRFCFFVHSFHDSLVVEIDSLNVISWNSSSVVPPGRFQFYFNEIKFLSLIFK